LHPPTCFNAASGTRVLTLSDAHGALASQPRVLPLIGRNAGNVYGPVFWRHGRLVVVFDGDLRALNGHGGLGTVVGRGLPSKGVVDALSSDPSGEHLLMTDEGITYRWDAGKLTVVPGEWDQPGW
jgi:hypothetical protein